MLACFPCGRSARFAVEPSRAPSSAPKCSPSPEERNYFNDMNKDPCSLIAEVKSHLNMGSSHPKDMDFSSQDKNFINSIAIDAMTIHDKEFVPPSNVALIHQFDGYREEKEQQLVVSPIVVKNRAICSEYNAEEGKDDYNIIEDHTSSMNTPMKQMTCSKEEKEEDLISSNLEVDFIQDKERDSKEEEKDKLCRKLVSGPADGEELLKKAIPEGGKTCGMRVAQHTDDHQNAKSDYNEINMSGETSSTQDGEDKQGRTVRVADGDYIGCYGKGVISQSKAEPRVLFSYGISDQQRDFLFLCAGLVIQAVGFQLRSIVEVITALIVLCYRAYIFRCRFVDTLSRTKQKLAEKHTSLFSQVAIDSTRLALHRERWESMKPLLIQGAKKMGWGCLNVAYVLAMLGALLLTSFLFSYLVVKGGATQKPIHISKELYFDYTKAHPVASLDLFSLDAYSRMANASKGTKVNPGATNFRYQYRYRCTILLTLPESDYNRELGVFQVTSELLSEKGEMVVKASQPCMLVFKSTTLHYVKSIFMAIPLLTGLASETQTLRLHLLEWHYNANARVLQILLVPRAGHAINKGLPQLYKAQIQIDSLHSPFIPSPSSSILRALFKWILLSFLIFGCLASFCMYRMHHKS